MWHRCVLARRANTLLASIVVELLHLVYEELAVGLFEHARCQLAERVAARVAAEADIIVALAHVRVVRLGLRHPRYALALLAHGIAGHISDPDLRLHGLRILRRRSDRRLGLAELERMRDLRSSWSLDGRRKWRRDSLVYLRLAAGVSSSWHLQKRRLASSGSEGLRRGRVDCSRRPIVARNDLGIGARQDMSAYTGNRLRLHLLRFLHCNIGCGRGGLGQADTLEVLKVGADGGICVPSGARWCHPSSLCRSSWSGWAEPKASTASQERMAQLKL